MRAPSRLPLCGTAHGPFKIGEKAVLGRPVRGRSPLWPKAARISDMKASRGAILAATTTAAPELMPPASRANGERPENREPTGGGGFQRPASRPGVLAPQRRSVRRIPVGEPLPLPTPVRTVRGCRTTSNGTGTRRGDGTQSTARAGPTSREISQPPPRRAPSCSDGWI